MTQRENTVDNTSFPAGQAGSGPTGAAEETLDPEDWESMRALGHRMLDDMLDYTRTVRERPAWQHIPDRVKAHLSEPLPLDPQPPEDVYQEFLDYVLPYPVGNIHPRFWGWVIGTGTVFGAFAELLAAAMNTNTGASITTAPTTSRDRSSGGSRRCWVSPPRPAAC